MSRNTIQTRSFLRIDPFNPDPSLIRARDIQHALKNVNRYTGHAARAYSVAEHCAQVAEIAKALAVSEGHTERVFSHAIETVAMVHDASEAYFNDLATPVKSAAQNTAVRDADAKLQTLIEKELLPGYNVEHLSRFVKEADAMALQFEAVIFMGVADPVSMWGLPELTIMRDETALRDLFHDFVYRAWNPAASLARFDTVFDSIRMVRGE